jgi:ankyrin repeat protein
MGAAVRGLMDMVTLLVSKGVDVRGEDKEGRTAAGYAALAGEQAVVKYFQTLRY